MSGLNSAVASMHARWRAIEREYGQPLRDVILAYRGDGNPWHVVAGALDVSDGTLRRWRRLLGLEVDKADTLHVRVERGRRHADRHAQAVGYPDIRAAIYELRVGQRLTWHQVAERLGVCERTLMVNAPPDIRGEYHMSPEGRAYKRRWAAAMRQRAWAKLRRERGHPWQRDEDIRIAACSARLSAAREEPGASGCRA